MKVLVLGGAGFIGRHCVAALLASGHQVEIGTRHPGRMERRLGGVAADCSCRAVRLERMIETGDWQAPLAGIDAVINCVGILRERGRETYRAVHQQAPTALAAACLQRQLRLVHVSALGLQHPHRSGFLRSKREGELALSQSGADYRLVRPSLLDGEGGFGARWIRRVSRWPVHPVPSGADGRIAALDVGELGEALCRIMELSLPPDASACQREFELGGTQACDLASYLQAMRLGSFPSPAWRLPVPAWLARIGSHVCDVLHFSPFSFGHWELLRYDNLPRHNRLAEILGREPRAVLGRPALVTGLTAAAR